MSDQPEEKRVYDMDGNTHAFHGQTQLEKVIDAAIIYARTGQLPERLPLNLPADPIKLIKMGVASAYASTPVYAVDGTSYDSAQSQALVNIVAKNVKQYVPRGSAHSSIVSQGAAPLGRS